MKKYLAPLILTLVIAACNNEEPQPVVKLIPDTFVEENFTKVFIHNDAGQLIQIKMISTFPNGDTMESVQDFIYNTNGQLAECTTDTGWRMVYFFEGDKIIRTDEYVSGVKSEYHTYSYNNKNQLIESISYQDIPEEGGEIPVAKDTYQYDDNDNLMVQQLYYYTAFGAEARLLTTFTFSEYDDKINSSDYFNASPFNPLMTFRKNNPGKMIIQNAKGIVGSTETYAYEYHADGYASKKTTKVIMLTNPDAGSYVSTYKFK
jgi:hypothetical protein